MVSPSSFNSTVACEQGFSVWEGKGKRRLKYDIVRQLPPKRFACSFRHARISNSTHDRGKTKDLITADILFFVNDICYVLCYVLLCLGYSQI